MFRFELEREKSRDWELGISSDRVSGAVHDKPSDAGGDNVSAHVRDPLNVADSVTPIAALETAKRIAHAAIEVLLDSASSSVILTETKAKVDLV